MVRSLILLGAVATALGGCAQDFSYGYWPTTRPSKFETVAQRRASSDGWADPKIAGPVDTRKLFDVLDSRMPLGGPAE